jgi:hypothetical protein
MSGPRTGDRDVTLASGDKDVQGAEPLRFMALKRLTMAGVTAFIAINLWTGAPLLAVWVGSQVGDQSTLTMKAVFVVMLVLAVLVTAMTVALTWLSNTYDELIGRPRTERRAPWLRSMRAEAEGDISSRVGITALERVVIISVYVAVITLLVWLVFFAGSMVPSAWKG